MNVYDYRKENIMNCEYCGVEIGLFNKSCKKCGAPKPKYIGGKSDSENDSNDSVEQKQQSLFGTITFTCRKCGTIFNKNYGSYSITKINHWFKNPSAKRMDKFFNGPTAAIKIKYWSFEARCPVCRYPFVTFERKTNERELDWMHDENGSFI
jgi:hypothetical protein